MIIPGEKYYPFIEILFALMWAAAPFCILGIIAHYFLKWFFPSKFKVLSEWWESWIQERREENISVERKHEENERN